MNRPLKREEGRIGLFFPRLHALAAYAESAAASEALGVVGAVVADRGHRALPVGGARLATLEPAGVT
jgi:hypothetical protein